MGFCIVERKGKGSRRRSFVGEDIVLVIDDRRCVGTRRDEMREDST